MKKTEFIDQIGLCLKEQGFKNKGSYWHKAVDKHLCCVYVQGSQWDKEDYYVEIGFSDPIENGKCPTLLHWTCSHRCMGKNGDKNILPEDLLAEMGRIFDKVRTSEELVSFLEESKAVKVAGQLWF